MKYGLDEQTVRTVNWLKDQAQRVVVDNGAEYALSKSADDTELGAVADMPEGCATIQRDIDSLEELQKVQQKELQIPASEEGQPNSSCVNTGWGQSAGKQLCRRSPGKCPCGEQDQQYPGLHQKKHCWQVKRGVLFPSIQPW
ncbi:hypothetical protein DUI87_10090 [Hirundo rustica rustica]|uniref:Uncharacterized protein n=1 Tax=Hirundo rustica rustica TaxID=333673 RepID=A0A3M0KNJ8_HIRRU|nr:hypothetical protein DUI87_10090 [Hirundo rustica rustica]